MTEARTSKRTTYHPECLKLIKPDNNMTPNRPAIRIPWWVHLLLALLIYPFLYYLIPYFITQSPSLSKYTGLLQQLAPLATIPFLFFAAFGLYDSDKTSSTDMEEGDH
jgi:hypothetical protein